MSKNIKQILGLFGSHAKVAKAAGMKGASGVENWIARDSIPHEKRLNLLRNCEQFGVNRVTLCGLLLDDYFNILTGKENG
ncbi:MAG: hypothetical protein JKY81_01585 [Colwellia sp.]|nr:hypothetical protein [Colwellia sp.]